VTFSAGDVIVTDVGGDCTVDNAAVVPATYLATTPVILGVAMLSPSAKSGTADGDVVAQTTTDHNEMNPTLIPGKAINAIEVALAMPGMRYAGNIIGASATLSSMVCRFPSRRARWRH
jgi:hypothetical protein